MSSAGAALAGRLSVQQKEVCYSAPRPQKKYIKAVAEVFKLKNKSQWWWKFISL